MLSTRTAAWLLCASLAAAGQPKGPLDIEPEDLRPGLVAEYRSLADAKATLTRIDPKPAFTLGWSSPHPRLPAGPFEVVWTGVLNVRDAGPLSYSAFVGGEVTVTVDGVVVVEGKGTTDSTRLPAKAALDRPPGYYRLEVRYKSLADVPARLQLWWEGPSFAGEPLPAWRLGHIAKELSPAANQEQRALRGLAAVQTFGCARCHSSAFPSVAEPPPGPSLADAGRRIDRSWLVHWLADPAKVRPGAHMPGLFSADRAGFVERWIVASELGANDKRPEEKPRGDHRNGRLVFLGLGCAACHFVPDVDRSEQADLN